MNHKMNQETMTVVWAVFWIAYKKEQKTIPGNNNEIQVVAKLQEETLFCHVAAYKKSKTDSTGDAESVNANNGEVFKLNDVDKESRKQVKLYRRKKQCMAKKEQGCTSETFAHATCT